MWKDEFDGNLYFSHGKSNLCEVPISFSVTELCGKMSVWCKWLNRDFRNIDLSLSLYLD